MSKIELWISVRADNNVPTEREIYDFFRDYCGSWVSVEQYNMSDDPIIAEIIKLRKENKKLQEKYAKSQDDYTRLKWPDTSGGQNPHL